MGLNEQYLAWQEHVAKMACRLSGLPELRGYAVKTWHGDGLGIDRHCLCNATSGEIINAK